MLSNIRHEEIVEEITEDFELQAGLVLSSKQISILKTTNHLDFSVEELTPFIDNIKTYLRSTPAESRVWDCCRSLSGHYYTITIHIS